MHSRYIYYVVPIQKQPKCLSTTEWIDVLWEYLYNQIQHSNEKEQITVQHNNLKKSHKLVIE